MNTYLIIDDSDPTIRYTGQWVPSVAPHESLTNVGNSGPPMFDTLHVLPSSNGTISLNFTGSAVAVFISKFGPPLNYTSQCLVDGITLPTIPDTHYPVGSNIQLCSTSSLPDQQHELFISISVPGDGNQPITRDSTGFFFDYVLVKPSPSMNIDLQNKLLTFNDSPCASESSTLSQNDLYSPSIWMASDDGSQIKCTLSFTGIAATWIGFYDPSMPRTPAQSSYQIDGGTLVPFNTTPTSQWFVSPEYVFSGLTHQTLFRAQSLPIGTHTMQIVSNADNKTTPLTLQQIIVQVSVVAQQATATVVAEPVIAGPSPSSPMVLLPISSRKPNTRAIAGWSSAGAVVFLLVVSALCFILLKRKRLTGHNNVHSAEELVADPFTHVLGRRQTTISPRKFRASQQGVANPLMQSLRNPPVTKWTRQAAELSANSIRPLVEPTLPVMVVSEPRMNEGPSRVVPVLRNTAERIDTETYLTPGTLDIPRESRAVPSARHIYEEDSGVRLHQDNTDAFALLFPPEYTTH